MLVWEDRFYDEPINKVKAQLNSTKCNGIMFIEHTWRQLKKSVEWYEKQCGLVDYMSVVNTKSLELLRVA